MCRHAAYGQKRYEIAGLPQHLPVHEAALADDAALRVSWSDGPQLANPSDWRAGHDLSPAVRARRAGKVKSGRSGIGADMPRSDWLSMLAHSARELAWLERYAEPGFGVLHNVAREPGTVAQVGERLDFVWATNDNRRFDVMSVPHPTNLAYTAVGLGDRVVMRNDRTLHGRTAFDPNLGRRHWHGCYIDGDAMESRRLILRRAGGGAPLN
ncbi:MAG: hypothetical protein H7274_11215 [Rhodoferax sp.]|nr:hypothetical protein [Rhodoferax sp.]